jgi:heme/copper-type cytochrome/quinol oxidase subunit 4
LNTFPAQDQAPRFSPDRQEVRVFPTNVVFDDRLTYLFNHQSDRNDNGLEQGDYESFAAAYPHVISLSTRQHILVVSSELRGLFKLAIVLLLLVIVLTPGLIVFLHTANYALGGTLIASGVSIFALLVTVFGKK